FRWLPPRSPTKITRSDKKSLRHVAEGKANDTGLRTTYKGCWDLFRNSSGGPPRTRASTVRALVAPADKCVASIDGQHHVRGLDHGIDLLARRERQLIGRGLGDHRDDLGAAGQLHGDLGVH